jgi:hypothetical protein
MQALLERTHRRIVAPPLESHPLRAPRRRLQEEHEAGTLPLPDPKIMGFHPEHAGGPREAEGNNVQGHSPRGPGRTRREFPFGKISQPPTQDAEQRLDGNQAATMAHRSPNTTPSTWPWPKPAPESQNQRLPPTHMVPTLMSHGIAAESSDQQ